MRKARGSTGLELHCRGWRYESCHRDNEETSQGRCDRFEVWRTDFDQSWFVSRPFSDDGSNSTSIGGPGGAGTFFMPIYGAALQEIVDTPNEKYFDILSWDPRGIGFTTPSHPGISDPGTLREFTQQLSSIGLSLEENEVFNKVWSLEGIYGVTISSYTAEQMESGELVGQFVSTANVVRDMVEIIERHGEWREKTARTAGSLDEDVQRIAWRQGKEPLQYWGFSYGTILGQAFASMQPSRVYRVVLDGVADAEDYMATGWTSNLWDIEKINEKFAAACVDAGEDLCPIAAWSPGDAAGLLSKFLAALEDLKSNPVATMIGDTPVFVSHSDVLQTIFALWYNGYVGFGATAQLMAELSSNNVSTIFSRRPPFSCQHPNVMIRDTNAASAGVLCTDGQSVVNETKADYREYMSLLRHQSPTFADIWATIRMPCHGYGVRAKWRFSGPFGAKTPVGILFASQDLDPVTPLRNAISASNLFPGSQVLEVQGGAGHCTLGFPSICAAKKIREYFRTGSLSTDRTVCPVSADPFWTQEMQEAGLEKLSAQDQKVAKLVMEVATAWPPREQQLFERSSVFSM